MKESDLNDERAFAEQWDAVVENYPLVAIRYAELLCTVCDELRNQQVFRKQIIDITKICDENSKIQIVKELHNVICNGDGPEEYTGPEPRKRCGQILRDESKIKDYIECVLSGGRR